MGEKEKRIIGEILCEMPDNQRLFRINAGMGWAGKVVSNKNGRIVLKDARPLHGAPSGWPDLSGWTTIEITPDMVGQQLAVFTGLEVKATGRLNKDQKMFRDILMHMGGIFEVVTDD